MGIRENIAANITRKFRELGISQGKFAELLGVTQGATSQWMSGEKSPKDVYMDQMKEVFGWSYEELVRDLKDPDDPIIEFMRSQLAVRGYHVVKKVHPKR